MLSLRGSFVCVQGVCICIYVKKNWKKKRKISTCVYVHSIIHHWACILITDSLRGSRSLSFPSLHSLLVWLHSMFDLSLSSLFFLYSLFRYHPRYCFWFILFVSPPCSFLTVTYSRFTTLFTLFLYILLLVQFVSFISSLILYSH